MQRCQADINFKVEECHGLTNVTSSQVRQSMSKLPFWIQGFLTWLTTQPLPNENKSYTSAYQIITAFFSLIVGIMLGILSLEFKEYILFLPSWLLTVSGMRKLQVVIYHHCSHGNVFKSKFNNAILGEIISILLVIKDFKTYKKDHMAHHKASTLLTYEDETAQDLAEIGIVPGLPKNILWGKLLLSFISPFSHARWMLNRFQNCFLSLNFLHNIFALTFWIFLFVLVSYLNIWNEFVIIWLFPLTVLYHISRILRLIAEHRWPNREVMLSRGKMFVCLSTVAVFNGESLPAKTGNQFHDLCQIVLWMLKMNFVHLFSRIFVLVGDTPCHDYHHRRPNSKEWSNYIYARQADKNNGCVGYPLNYLEEWGMFNAIDKNLDSISKYKI